MKKHFIKQKEEIEREWKDERRIQPHTFSKILNSKVFELKYYLEVLIVLI